MSRFKSFSNPILFVGDSPALAGGLSRIGRDLATLAATLPSLRVGYLARGSGNTRRLPFTVYTFPESDGWGQNQIEEVWNDFSGGQYGIILTTDDLSRRGWFANPAQYGRLAKFLGDGRTFQKWAYTPIDAAGPGGLTLGVEMTAAAMGYDRILAASEFGRDVLIRSGRPDADYLPHGVFSSTVFKPHPNPRPLLGWDEDDIVCGMVAANQSRKDFPVAFETFALLKAHYGNRFKAWLNTNAMVHAWNIYALAADYGVGDCLEVTMDLTEEALALRYSACDVTILPSGGEGFSYTTAESLACGTAQIVADHAAARELVQEECRVPPVAYRVDTIHNVQRAVLSGYGFANACFNQIEKKRTDREFRGEELRETVSHLDWQRLQHPWKRWLLEGLK